MAGVLFAPWSSWRVISSIGKVQPGSFSQALVTGPAIPAGLLSALDISSASVSPAPSGTDGSARSATKSGPGSHRASKGDAATAAVLTAGVGLYEWFTPDERVLDAMSQMTHENIDSSLDLWSAVRENHYNLWSEGSLYKWRGAVGEQDVYDDLQSWLGDRVQLWSDSNHAGSDITIDGQEFNVKVTADAASTASDHFADHPDIPIIVNSDAANIPSDAFHVDFSQPFDPAILDGHSVILSDGLALGGMEDALGDAFGDAVGGDFDAADLFDNVEALGIPVIGTAIRVVRSGMREGALVDVHNSKTRMIKNIATDVTLVGGGVMGGGGIGMMIGGAVDVLSGGLTLGAGTWVGGAIGSWLGAQGGNAIAKEVRFAAFYDAQADVRYALESYTSEVERVEDESTQIWDEFISGAKEDAERVANDLGEATDRVIARLRVELQCEHLIGDAAVSQMVAQASERVVAAEASERSSLARKRANDWHQAALSARTREERLDVVQASPGGSRAIKALMADVSEHRTRSLSVATAGIKSAHETALAYRADMATSIHECRDELQGQISEILDPLAAELDAANAQVVHEGQAAGLFS
jgi:hypothetical protein